MIVIPGLTFKVTCDLIITASTLYYLYTGCTIVKQCVNLWWCGIRSYKMMASLRRTIAATTKLALYSIITGALALFVPRLLVSDM
jgi:hypothetical protein